jgi:hypothetical protein
MYSGETGQVVFWAVGVLAFAKPEVEGPTCLALIWPSVSLAFRSMLSVALTRP